MTSLDHVLERSVTIRAKRSTVFRFFTDSERFAAWWGAGSRIDPRPGGEVHIRYPNGVVAAGAVVELREPDRIVFTYGYEGAGKPIPPGGSLVTVTLEEVSEGTLLRLCHAFAGAEVRDQHVQGWRHQLAVFAVAASRDQNRDVESVVDRFLALWSEADEGARLRELAAIALPTMGFRDAFAATDGVADLSAHVAAALVFMPGMRLERRGEVRHCQGTAIADWVALAADGAERGRGCNVFELAPDSRIARAVGFWS